MKLQFWAIGRNHEQYVEAGINDFTKRIKNYFPVSWNIIPVPKNASLLTEADLKKKEADAVIKSLSDQDYLVLLDENGRSFTSAQLADFVQQRANESSRNVIFLIGGAYGVDALLKKRANFSL